VHSLVHDPESGRLWAATRHGLFHRDARGRWLRDFEFPGRMVHQLLVWRGGLAAVGSAGLHVYVQSAWSEIAFLDAPVALFTAAAGEGGLVLAGRPGTGFYVWRPGAASPVDLPLPVGRTNCMAWDDAGGLWIGTDRGLVRWNGEEARVLRWNADPDDHVSALLVHAGRLYVGSHAGVWIAPLAGAAGLVALSGPEAPDGDTLERAGRRLGLLEGLPNPHVASMVVHDDRVWVGTRGGLALLAREV
jgi:ligand-binding sensor domain-containing protein